MTSSSGRVEKDRSTEIEGDRAHDALRDGDLMRAINLARSAEAAAFARSGRIAIARHAHFRPDRRAMRARSGDVRLRPLRPQRCGCHRPGTTRTEGPPGSMMAGAARLVILGGRPRRQTTSRDCWKDEPHYAFRPDQRLLSRAYCARLRAASCAGRKGGGPSLGGRIHRFNKAQKDASCAMEDGTS